MTALQSPFASASTVATRSIESNGTSRFGRPSFWTVFWALVAAVIPVMRSQNVFGIGQIPLQRIAFVVLLALVVSALFGKLARPVGVWVWLAAGLFVPFAGFVSGENSSIVASTTVALQFAVLCVLAPAVFRYHVENTRDFLPWVLGAFLLSQSLSASVGLLQVAGFQAFNEEVVDGRASGLAGHPNALGIMAVIALLLAVALLAATSRAAKAAVWCALVINAVALVATGSLSSILAAAVGIAVFLMGRRRVLLGLAVGVFGWVVGTVVGFANAGFVSFLEYRIAVVTGEARVGGDASVDARFLTYEWALEHISRDSLAGVGMDDSNAGTFNGVTEVHNYLLHAWYQGGVLLLLWFIAVTLLLIVVIVRAVRYRQGVGAAAIAAALITFAMTSAFFLQQQYWLPLLLAVALLPHGKLPEPKPVRKIVAIHK